MIFTAESMSKQRLRKAKEIPRKRCRSARCGEKFSK